MFIPQHIPSGYIDIALFFSGREAAVDYFKRRAESELAMAADYDRLGSTSAVMYRQYAAQDSATADSVLDEMSAMAEAL